MTQARRLPHPGTAWRLVAFPLAGGAVRLVSGGDEGVRAWDPATGEQTAAFDELTAPMNDMAVCRPAGRDPVLAVATDFGVQWFDTVTGTPCFGPTIHDTIWGLTTGPGPDGREVLFGTGYGDPYPVRRWDSATGAMLPDLGEHNNHIVAVATFTLPSGTALAATGGWAGTIQRWDPASGQAYGEPLVGHEGVVNAIDGAPHPDGRLLLASADSAGVVCRWDAATGEQIGAPIRVDDPHVSVLLVPAPSGLYLLTSGFEDEVIRRWDAVTGQPLGEFGHGFHPVLFPLDGTTMMATAGSGGILVRQVEPIDGDPTLSRVLSTERIE